MNFWNRERSTMIQLSTFLKFNIIWFIIPCSKVPLNRCLYLQSKACSWDFSSSVRCLHACMTALRSATAYFTSRIFWRWAEASWSASVLQRSLLQKKLFTGSNKSGSDSGSFILIVKSSQVIVWSLKSSVMPSSLMILTSESHAKWSWEDEWIWY